VSRAWTGQERQTHRPRRPCRDSSPDAHSRERHPAGFYPDICAAIEDHRPTDAHRLQTAGDGLDTDPLYLALEEPRARKAAADAEMRRLLVYGREFHGTRPYRLESLAEASGMTPSPIRTAYDEEELRQVAHEIHREPNGKAAHSGPTATSAADPPAGWALGRFPW
jgi:hypothetical protein